MSINSTSTIIPGTAFRYDYRWLECNTAVLGRNRNGSRWKGVYNNMDIEDDFSRAVDLIYAAGMDPAGWDDAMLAIRGLAKASGSYLLLVDRRTGMPVSGVVHGASDEAYGEDIKYHAWLDEYWPRVLELSSGAIQPTAQRITQEEINSSACYNEFPSKYDSQTQATTRLDISPDRDAVLTVFRGRGDSEYGDDDLKIYRRLLPHIQRAVQINVKMADLDLDAAAAVEQVDNQPHGVIFLDENGRIIFANRFARAILEAADAFTDGPEGLAAIRVGDDARLQDCIASAIAGSLGARLGAGGALTLMRRNSPHPYSVLVAPISRREAIFASARPAAVVLIGDPDATPELPTRHLRRLYGLTKREADIAAMIASGKSASACADAFAITARTAQFHVQNIFAKTGVHSQGGLIKLLLTSGLGRGYG